MRRKRRAPLSGEMLLAVLALLAVSACAATPDTPVYDWTPVDEAISAILDEKVFPGCVAAIASEFRTVFNQPPPLRHPRCASLWLKANSGLL